MSMMIGVAFSLGLVSMRVTPSIRSGMSSSAGSDIGPVLLVKRNLFHGSGSDRGEERRKRRDLVGGALDADHRGTVDVERRGHGGGKPIGVADVHRRQAREHRRQARTQPAGTKTVVAVQVV